jgi:hypothetical protein
MQAIQTRYFGPTNFKGSRIKATCSGGSVTVGYDHALNITENHQAAAEKLVVKMDWNGGMPVKLVGGWLPSDDMAWVWSNGGVSPTVTVPAH